MSQYGGSAAALISSKIKRSKVTDYAVLKVKLEFTLVLLNPELTLFLLIPFLKTLDPDQLVSFRGHLIRIYSVFHSN